MRHVDRKNLEYALLTHLQRPETAPAGTYRGVELESVETAPERVTLTFRILERVPSTESEQ